MIPGHRRSRRRSRSAWGLWSPTPDPVTQAISRSPRQQPKIVDNQKGLLVDFNIIDAQVGNQPVQPSLTIDMGSIASGQTAVGTGR